MAGDRLETNNELYSLCLIKFCSVLLCTQIRTLNHSFGTYNTGQCESQKHFKFILKDNPVKVLLLL